MDFIKNKLKKYDRKTWFVLLFFAIFFLSGIFISKNYGISWDEDAQRDGIGIPAYEYIRGQSDRYLTEKDRYYGPVFEIFLAGVEKAFKIDEIGNVFLMRHALTFTIFFISTIFFYKICKILFKSRKIALLGTLLLIISPRIFAESFYNSKDLTFLSLYIISSFTLLDYFQNKSYRNLFFHALSTGILIDIRILGILMIGLTLIFFLTDLIKNKDFKKIAKELIIYLIITAFFIYLFMPILWHSPITNFIEAFKQMKKFPWDGGVLFNGHVVNASQLPWYYLIKWIIISTPVIYQIFFCFGLIYFVFKEFRIYKIYEQRNILFFLTSTFLPLFLIIILNSIVYDSWRHVYFIYPSFLIIAIYGLKILSESLFVKNYRNLFFIVVVALISPTIFFMIVNHPFQNVYFNAIYRSKVKEPKRDMELDYWGLSYRQGLEYILKNDNRTKIKIFVENYPGLINIRMIKVGEQDRFEYVDEINKSDYFLTNYRTRLDDYLLPIYKVFEYSNVKFLYIYKVK